MLTRAFLYALLLFAFIATIDGEYAAISKVKNAAWLVPVIYISTACLIYLYMKINQYLQGYGGDSSQDQYEQEHKIASIQ